MTARYTFFFAVLATLALIGCTKGKDETITVSIPKGYSAPTPIPNDSWEDRMKQIMAHGLESEAVAADATTVPQPSKLERPRRTLTTKTGRRARNHGHKSADRTGRGRHGRHAR